MKPTDHSEKDLQLEELLRFKRAERPEDAYWSRFDRELHQRMLHALVKKDPFYLQVLRGLTGKRLPTGILTTATAVLALVALAPSIDPVSTPATLATATPQQEATVPVSGDAVVDYAIDSISVGAEEFQRDFGMDRVEASGFAQADYSVQQAATRNSGAVLASLTF